MAPVTQTFHSFKKLPLELQNIIWKTAASDSEPRVLTVEEMTPKGVAPHVKQSYPALLSTCSASRKLALQTYGCTSSPATPKYSRRVKMRQKLHTETESTRTTPWALTIPNAPPSVGFARIIHMAYHEESENIDDCHLVQAMPWIRKMDQYTACNSCNRCNNETGHPVWIDTTRDVLLFNDRIFLWENDSRLFHPGSKYRNTQLEHVAFNCDTSDGHPLPSPVAGRTWYGGKHLDAWLTKRDRLAREMPDVYGLFGIPVRFESHRALEHLGTILLLFPEACEVIILSLDETGDLKPGQWTFELDTKSQIFKQEMGQQWAGVTWRVVLGKKNRCSLHEMALAWRPICWIWAEQQRRLCTMKLEIGELEDDNIWLTTHGKSIPPSLREDIQHDLVLVQQQIDADEETCLELLKDDGKTWVYLGRSVE